MRALCAPLLLAVGCGSPMKAPPSPPAAPPTSEQAAHDAPGTASTPDAPPPVPRPETLPIPSGLAVGEVGATNAIVWSRCDREALVHAQLADGLGEPLHLSAMAVAEKDFAVSLTATALRAGQRYGVRVWCSEAEDTSAVPRLHALEGSFTTAPSPSEPRSLRFSWSGDLGGQNVCRDARQGYPIFEPMQKAGYDFFIGLGDMIYADSPCTAVGLWGNPQVARAESMASTLAGYHAHWRYNRDDANFRAFLATTPYYGVWDDHEVLNDWGPKTDMGRKAPYRPGEHLMPAALQAMLDYNPLPQGGVLYRSQRWGRHLELFFVDARRYRDENSRKDSARAQKHMLGAEQREWLLGALGASDATWKVIVSSVPLSIPTGLGRDARDGFADYGGDTGFEQELLGLLQEMQHAGIKDTVWLTTDAHMAAGFVYTPFPATPDFKLSEFVSGPLSAGFFPRDVYDKTLNPERLFTWAVDNVGVAKDYESAKKLLNYGEVEIDGTGSMIVRIRDAFGEVVRSAEVARH